MKEKITIRMPKRKLAKWLKALRSGEYKQGEGALRNRNRFCCLGVMEHCLTGAIKRSHKGTQPLRWLAEQRITFLSSHGHLDDVPYLPTLNTGATDANDDGTSFAEIADAIEACAEGY